MQKISLEEGIELVKLARKSIEYAMASGKKLREETQNKNFLEKKGAFVTLKTFPEEELRGCIGRPYPSQPLWNAIIDSATDAAFNDDRFGQLSAKELEKIVIEISVMTIPMEIKRKKEELPEKIKIGEDGLIIETPYTAGLLLPQVASEEKWDSETFLQHLCLKAGLNPEEWKNPKTKISKFQAQIFKEEKPNGKIVEEKI